MCDKMKDQKRTGRNLLVKTAGLLWSMECFLISYVSTVDTEQTIRCTGHNGSIHYIRFNADKRRPNMGLFNCCFHDRGHALQQTLLEILMPTSTKNREINFSCNFFHGYLFCLLQQINQHTIFSFLIQYLQRFLMLITMKKHKRQKIPNHLKIQCL